MQLSNAIIDLFTAPIRQHVYLILHIFTLSRAADEVFFS